MSTSFGDLYKNVKNIINPKVFVSDNQFSVKTSNNSFSATVDSNLSKNKTSLKWSDSCVKNDHKVTVEGKVDQAANLEIDIACKNNTNGGKWGLVVDANQKKTAFKVTNAYAFKNSGFNVKNTYKYAKGKTNNLTVAAAYEVTDDVIIGAEVELKPAQYATPANILGKYSVAARVITDGVTSAVQLNKESVKVGIAAPYKNKTTVAVEFEGKFADKSTAIQVGAECKATAGTTYNARFNSKGAFNVGAKTKVNANTSVKFGAEFDTAFNIKNKGMKVEFTL